MNYILVHHHEKSGINFVRISELPKEIQEDFKYWMRGQTTPSFSEFPDAVYFSDFLNYTNGGKISD